MTHNTNKGRVFWFTGLSGAGKTTLALKLRDFLKANDEQVTYIDGDEVRSFFENALGFSEKDRTLNIKAMGFAAKLASEAGNTVIVANIAPYAEVREFLREKLPTYTEIFVKASLETVMTRDTKGIYKKFQEGKAKQVTGLDDRYDTPTRPDLIVETDNASLEESFAKVLTLFDAPHKKAA